MNVGRELVGVETQVGEENKKGKGWREGLGICW
jgi:hypothetical protein